MRRRLPFILAFAIPFVVYLPTLTGTFYYDDNVVFFGHQVKVLAADPMSVFSARTHYLPGAPRSIHVFFLLLIYKAFGAHPLPYHAFNLLMHSASTLLVFLLLRRLLSAGESNSAPKSETVPLLGSLIFGLHPVHVENITFVTLGGTDIFYTMWALLSLMCYVWFRDKTFRGIKNYVLLAASAIAFALALMSKESAVAFVLIYPLTEFALGRRGFLWALPNAAVLIVMKRGILTGSAVSAMKEVAGGEVGAAGPMELIKGLGFFAKSLVIPYPHMPYIKEFPGAPLLYAFAALVLLWLVAGVISRRRAVSYSAIWFVALSGPYLFVPTIVTNVAITAERYIYAPSVSLAILGGWALTTGWDKEKLKPKLKAAAIIVLTVYAVLGSAYFYQAWRTEEAFWRYAIKTNPDYVSAYSSLATIELQKGNPQKAEQILREGLAKKKGMPVEFAQTAYALANMYWRQGDTGDAEKYYLLALRYADYEFAYAELGFLYLDSGRLEPAKRALQGALTFRRNPRVLAGLALAHARLGEKQKALAYAQEAYQRARDPELKSFALGIMNEVSK